MPLRTGRRAGGAGSSHSLTLRTPAFSGPHCRADSNYCTRSRRDVFLQKGRHGRGPGHVEAGFPSQVPGCVGMSRAEWIWVFPLNWMARSGGYGFFQHRTASSAPARVCCTSCPAHQSHPGPEPSPRTSALAATPGVSEICLYASRDLISTTHIIHIH